MAKKWFLRAGRARVSKVKAGQFWEAVVSSSAE